MPTPYLHDDLFKINPDLKLSEYHIECVGDILIIDDFYMYPDTIEEMLNDSWVLPWKYKKNSRNTKDYFDCRLANKLSHTEDIEFENQRFLRNKIFDFFKIKTKDTTLSPTFNIFKWEIRGISSKYQMYPHKDNSNEIASTIYLDSKHSGGTAFYTVKESSKGQEILKENYDIKVDVDKYYDFHECIEGIFNRCIIYPGHYLHGGYIDDHDFYTDNWRKNQVYFFEKETCTN